MKGRTKQLVLTLACLLVGVVLLAVPGSAAAGQGGGVHTESICWYRVHHVWTRLRVHSYPYVSAPVDGYLHPHQWARGGCARMWSVDRYWVHVVSPVDGYADAYYLNDY